MEVQSEHDMRICARPELRARQRAFNRQIMTGDEIGAFFQEILPSGDATSERDAPPAMKTLSDISVVVFRVWEVGVCFGVASTRSSPGVEENAGALAIEQIIL